MAVHEAISTVLQVLPLLGHPLLLVLPLTLRLLLIKLCFLLIVLEYLLFFCAHQVFSYLLNCFILLI
jgi:hypothetical protein